MVTMDEIWLYRYDQETKQQSLEWQHSGSPRTKNFRLQKSAGKILVSIFWGQDGILLIDYLSNGQTINAEYYSYLLMQLKEVLEEKDRGKFVTKWSCSCTTMPRLTRHLQPRIKLPTWASNVLITYPIFRIWPLRTTTCFQD